MKGKFPVADTVYLAMLSTFPENETEAFGRMESAPCFINVRSNALHSWKTPPQFPISKSKVIVEVNPSRELQVATE